MSGPQLIFDKSFLQALNPDESMWLDNFYTSNITPLFFVETLADLEKEVRKGRTPEQVVGSISNKTPDTGCVNTHHQNLLFGELTGQGTIEMEGRPILSRGRTVKLGNETGVIFNEPPEIESFHRWQKHQFLDIERSVARKWRDSLKNLVSEEEKDLFRKFLVIFGIPKSLAELKNQIDWLIEAPLNNESLSMSLAIIGVPVESRSEILGVWKNSGKKSIKEFAPYFAHVLSIDLFFHLGTAANLFSAFRHSQTHKIDVAYLYYLPFCKIFVSNDNLHIHTASLFMRQDQTFIKGEDLKKDLAKLDTHYSALPDEVKNRGVVSFASIPPNDTSFLTTQMWDKYMSSQWREIKTRKFDGTDNINPEIENQIFEKIRKFKKEAKPISHKEAGNSDEMYSVVLSHMVSTRKGKWKRFPPEIENSNKRILD
jgi:hypothetical protein